MIRLTTLALILLAQSITADDAAALPLADGILTGCFSRAQTTSGTFADTMAAWDVWQDDVETICGVSMWALREAGTADPDRALCWARAHAAQVYGVLEGGTPRDL